MSLSVQTLIYALILGGLVAILFILKGLIMTARERMHEVERKIKKKFRA